MYIKIPKNGFIQLEIKNGIIYSLNIEDEDLKAKAESELNKTKEELNSQCLQCEHVVVSCAGCLKDESFNCSHFSLDKDAIERIKLFHLNYGNTRMA